MVGRLIDSHIEGLCLRRTVENWPNKITTIIDGYQNWTSLSHAVQKDAIQNGWSARTKKGGKGWSFTFELLETSARKFLLMTDEGTTGLTGRVLTPEEYESDLPPEEKWGRFEGVAFTQDRAERTLGSRGRGKFVFVGASQEQTILYDTLRSDNTYRFGFRTIKKTDSPIAAFDDDEGRELLDEFTSGLIKPLDVVGARVIIVNPIEELVEDLKKGKFIRHIGETWWEIILKYNATIKVRADGDEHIATIPEEFCLDESDSEHVKVRTTSNQNILSSGSEIRIKKLYIAHNSDKITPEGIRGIAIQRDGMKICTIEPKYLSRDIIEGLYGFITLDSDAEEEILEYEGIEHYSYAFTKGLPRVIKRYIEDQTQRFAKEKLGYGMDARERRRQQQRNAERRALTAANNFAKELGIGLGPGLKPTGKRKKKQIEWKKTYLHMEELEFPRPSDLRINYEETLKNIGSTIVNKSDEDIEVRLKIYLRFDDGVVKHFIEEDVSIAQGSESKLFGPFEEKFEEIDYPAKGKYTITATIISLQEENKGEKLDYRIKSFYLEDDPPLGGLFERCDAVGLDDEPIKYWMGFSEMGSENALALYYNVNHPSYSYVAEEEEDLAEYIIRIAGQEICRFDLMQDSPKLFGEEHLIGPEDVIKQERQIVGELIYKFRKGDV